MYSLSETITTADPLAASRYSQSLNNALAQGHGNAEAAQLATNSLYTTLQQQSLLLALKEILGYLLVISIIIAVVSRFIPFHKTLRVTFKKNRRRYGLICPSRILMNGNAMIVSDFLYLYGKI